MDLIEAIKNRKSIRKFTDESIKKRRFRRNNRGSKKSSKFS